MVIDKGKDKHNPYLIKDIQLQCKISVGNFLWIYKNAQKYRMRRYGREKKEITGWVVSKLHYSEIVHKKTKMTLTKIACSYPF
jgi:hypothetical protein